MGVSSCTSKLGICSPGFVEPNILPAQQERSWGGWRCFQCHHRGFSPAASCSPVPMPQEGSAGGSAMEQSGRSIPAGTLWAPVGAQGSQGLSTPSQDHPAQSCFCAVAPEFGAPEQLPPSLVLENSPWWQQVAGAQQGGMAAQHLDAKPSGFLFFF